jgi:hypothetical protein
MSKRKISERQRQKRKFEIERFIGKNIEAIFLVEGESGIKQIPIADILERRDVYPHNKGYYLQASGVHLPLSCSRHEGYSGRKPRFYVDHSSAIESKLREIGRLV